ncbi:MAG: lactonase family protein [Polyangiaceae bacterium]|nr:lactonase family protein [Polyangiaceae bacterium]
MVAHERLHRSPLVLAVLAAACAAERADVRGAAVPAASLAGASAPLVGSSAVAPPVEVPPLSSRAVYVGTYTAPGTAPGGHVPSTATGISVFRMRVDDGGLLLVQTVAAENPSFLAVAPAGSRLYATVENGMAGGQPAGGVSAFAIDAKTGALSPEGGQPTRGTFPAHLSVAPSGTFLLASNYGTGTFLAYRLGPDGSIGTLTGEARGAGNGAGPRADRQEGPHAHQILTGPDGRCIFGVDLGSDRIYAWTLDADGRLAPAPVPSASVESGAGPRHIAFHPGGAVAYVISELSSTVGVFRYEPARCALVWAQTVSTLPAGYGGPNVAAEIRVHPSGRFVYATNRGHNSVAALAVDPQSGMLTPIGWEPSRGDWPRGMNIDPSGTFVYVANQNSNSIVVFRVDPAHGTLAATGAVVETPTPADVEFGPVLETR